MSKSNSKAITISSKYNGGLTREQFLFYEMRTTARLVAEGLTDEEIMNKVMQENLFQYPTERETKKMVKVCLTRLYSMNDESLIHAVAFNSSDDAKQICLYAMMKYNRLVWDFMITVIGEKFRQQDLSFGKLDLNVFFMRLQEQDDNVASWAESTVKKIKQVLVKILVENDYLESTRSDHLDPVLICSVLENAIRNNNDTNALSAFNCFI